MLRVVRIIAVLLACAVATAGISACGGDDDQDTASVSLTEKPRDLENGSSAGAPSTGALATSGDETSGAGGQAEAPPADGEATPEATTEPEAGGATDDAGAQIFTQSCASCHTLAAADANGQVGPNLDDSKLDVDAIVAQVENGGGGMPSFKGTLQPDQIQAVAAYVTAARGS
jgi:mono/diheme cytochrome c family protein